MDHAENLHVLKKSVRNGINRDDALAIMHVMRSGVYKDWNAWHSLLADTEADELPQMRRHTSPNRPLYFAVDSHGDGRAHTLLSNRARPQFCARDHDG
jgi:hypothetical protein